ncbi:MAG: HAD family hydrolase [Syntrophorhabdales bacterium]|jgi:HAD superfamily hydrolase (TIGR01509 family)
MSVEKRQEKDAAPTGKPDERVRQEAGLTMDAPMIADVQAMLFDFEGTLVDFQWKLSEAVEEALQALLDMGFARDRIRSRKYSTLLLEATQMAAEFGLQPDQVRERIGGVYDRYDEDALTRWSLRPGVKDFLQAMKKRGVRAGLVSNIGGRTLFRALSKLGLEGFFEVALSRNDVVNLKPSPDGMNLALERMGVRREGSMFLGDSLDDIHGARNAGLRVMIIAEGENLKEEILRAGPDHVIQGYEELLRIM